MRSIFLRSSSLRFSLIALAMSGCSFKASDNGSTQRKPIAAYCGYVSSPATFSSPVTVTGNATYQYRNDGNGPIPDGKNTWKPTVPTTYPTTFTLNVNAHIGTYTCANSTTCSLLKVVDGLISSLNTALAGTGLKANGVTAVGIYPSNGIDNSVALTVSGSANLTAQNARPIRYAEVQVTSDKGDVVQCTETDGSGAFSMQLPAGGHYNVNVLARSSNTHNTAYVMNSPYDNYPYKVTTDVTTSSNTSVTLQALATGSMEGGAFNILDQILNAQTYLRTTTADCAAVGSPQYLTGCVPVTTVPIVYSYWAPGLTPNAYYGDSSSPISFYLLGKSELYIGGGASGDAVNSDMDQFDNSVIVHEYGHFIEDKFGAPNSPGGSHNGIYPIDPRLAWGEGWANFFQAAVSGVPVYADTQGTVGCGKTSCVTGFAFLEPLETGTPFGTPHDQGSTLGEGNFREFSISRVMWSIIQPATSQFSEVWTAINGSSGMRVIGDPYKTVSRLHVIHSGFASQTNKKDWSSNLTTEKQVADFSGYATPVDVSSSCSTSSIAMSVLRPSQDDGSFAKSDQFRNNDFFLYNHPGGTLPVSLTWSGSGSVDLDLYIYQAGYVFGNSSSILSYDMRDAAGSTTGSALATTGNAGVSPNLAAGTYIINVMASTGAMVKNSANTTTYSLSIGGHAACPAP